MKITFYELYQKNWINFFVLNNYRFYIFQITFNIIYIYKFINYFYVLYYGLNLYITLIFELLSKILQIELIWEIWIYSKYWKIF